MGTSEMLTANGLIRRAIRQYATKNDDENVQNDMNQTLLSYSIAPNVRAFSTTRISPFPDGGGSADEMGSYAAFNVTHYCGDSPERVVRNREWLCSELSISREQLWLPRQTHTANVVRVDSTLVAANEEEREIKLNEVDALITNLPQQCIGVSTADCVPLLIFDPVTNSIAAVHAGWRGTVKRIVQATLRSMAEAYGTHAENCQAVIGPSISPDDFEVGEEVAEEFIRAGFPESVVVRRACWPKPHVDLWAANALQLEECGVLLQNIQVAGVSTFEHSDTFFSARKEGIRSGRIYTGIMLK